jgi:hypothetical protein
MRKERKEMLNGKLKKPPMKLNGRLKKQSAMPSELRKIQEIKLPRLPEMWKVKSCTALMKVKWVLTGKPFTLMTTINTITLMIKATKYLSPKSS